MPEYQYKCKKCNTNFVIVKSMLDTVITFCPTCASKEVQKIYSPVNVVYKSSGFYKTDTRKPLTSKE